MFERVAVPPSGAPAIGTDNFFFLTRLHGFAATTGGAGEIPKVGYQQPYDAGRIERTDDGGASWRTVWHGRHVVFSVITFANARVGVAAGAVTTGVNPGIPTQTPVLVATTNGGHTWRRLPRPPFPSDFFLENVYEIDQAGTVQTPSPNVWYAFTPHLSWPKFGSGLWRSADGGIHWRRVRTPPGTAKVAFPSPLVGYAAAGPRSCRTAEQLWKTVDGGASWVPVPSTCGPLYTSLDFLDPQHGFTSESVSAEFGEYALHVIIRATLDGGRHWQTRSRNRNWGPPSGWQTYTRLHFADRRHGWAVSAEWDQGFEWDSLHVTSDGGRTWQARRYPALPEGFVGGSAWTGAWRTNDWGRTWKLNAGPRRVAPQTLLVATGSRIDVQGIEAIESRDAGRSWRTRPTLSPLAAARASPERAYVQPGSSDFRNPVAYLRTRRGWRPLLPTVRWSSGAVAFRDAHHGLVASGNPAEDDARAPVYATADGGRTWRQVPLPPGVPAQVQVRLAPGIIVIPSGLDPPHTTVMFLSLDNGRHWLRETLSASFLECGVSRPTHASIWIACSPDIGGGRTILLRSRDTGSHWTLLTGSIPLNPHLIATDARTAWTLGRNATYGGPLWRTRDVGRTWREVWPTLSPQQRVYDLGSGRPY